MMMMAVDHDGDHNNGLTIDTFVCVAFGHAIDPRDIDDAQQRDAADDDGYDHTIPLLLPYSTTLMMMMMTLVGASRIVPMHAYIMVVRRASHSRGATATIDQRTIDDHNEASDDQQRSYRYHWYHTHY